MPASSPYQNNDYQAANSFRPYRLPVNDIFKANVAIDAYWDAGARRVADVYDTALNLKLKTTDNVRIRDQYMKDSEKQLVKLSSMNLADMGVQRQGMNIYAPLLRDQDIAGENFVVKNGEKELGIAEQFRVKDGGKNYNPMSVENIQFEQNLLSVDPLKGGLNKRDGWRSIVQAQSKYTPYADITKEYKAILDTVKANEIEKATLAGNEWYVEDIKTKGVSKDRISSAIQEMGSPQLKAQMGVEARNVFYKKVAADPLSVDGYYQNLAASYYDTKIGELQQRKAELEYDAYMTPNDSTDPEVRKNNTQRIKQNTDAAKELEKTINQLAFKDKPEYMSSFRGLGDTTNLAANIAKVEQLWQASSIDNLAGKLSWESKSRDIKANPAKIAQENLALGYERLQENYLQLAEQKRHNMAGEQIDLINALKPKAGKDGKDGEDGESNPAANPFANKSGTLNTTASNSANLATTAAAAEEVREYFVSGDEGLREAGVRNLIGDNGWTRIQEGISSNKTTAQALLPDELDSAAKLIKAFSDKKVEGGTKLFGVEIPFGATEEQHKAFISNLPVGTFKMMVGAIVKNDPDFTTDLVGKFAGENGVEKAAQFRSAYNKTLRDQINISDNVNTKVAENLGELARFFPNSGKVTLTNRVINDAYQKGMADPNGLIIYKKVPTSRTTGSGAKLTEQIISKEEYDKAKEGYDPSFYVQEFRPTLDEFKKSVRSKTDYLYANIKTESNSIEYPYVYNHKTPEKKTADIMAFVNNMAQTKNSDANPDQEAMLNYLKANSTDVEGRVIGLPGIGKQLPTVRFTVKAPTSKADIEAYGALVDKINSTNFPMTGLDPTFYRKPGEDAYIRNPGARIVYAPFKSNNQSGAIEIINYSASAAAIDPRIKVNGDLVYKYVDSQGKLVAKSITPQDIKMMFSQQYGGASIEEVIQRDGGPDEINKWLSGVLTNLEKSNKK